MKPLLQKKSSPSILPRLFQMAASLDTAVGTPAPSRPPARRKKGPAKSSAATLAAQSIAFQLTAPAASSVWLAADFTEWEKAPINLTRLADGTWQTAVALIPGRYAYRFIVDGQWQDDPDCPQWEANPFGSINAVIEVA